MGEWAGITGKIELGTIGRILPVLPFGWGRRGEVGGGGRLKKEEEMEEKIEKRKERKNEYFITRKLRRFYSVRENLRCKREHITVLADGTKGEQ